MPEGACADRRGPEYVVRPSICPDDPKKEPRHKGLAETDPEQYSPFFDSVYCEFPTKPWPVDRSTFPS